MYNRYDGNTGRFVRMPEPELPERSALRRPPPSQPRREEPPHREELPQRREERSQRRNESGPPPARRDGPYAQRRSSGDLGGLLSGVTDALGGLFRGGLETEDLLLMLILYLMYRESGDKELLIVLGAMLLL